MVEAGDFIYEEEVRVGLEEAPQALTDLYLGKNRGKMLVEVV